jgi:hypothetical protein
MAQRARERHGASLAQRIERGHLAADARRMAALEAMQIPPRIDAEHCGHGETADLSFDEIPFAGGRGVCECCGSSFGVISSGMIVSNGDGVVDEFSQTQNVNLCYGCGAIDEIVDTRPEERRP